jgi:heat shock protein HspQ
MAMDKDSELPKAATADKGEAQYRIGDLVRHRLFPFRGVIFDVDPEFSNSEEWLEAIPEDVRPRRNQPFYHLFAENEKSSYIAYVSQQNLLPDETAEPVGHPDIAHVFDGFRGGRYQLRRDRAN